ncbi:MAG: pyridoxal phosphate-dependent aminotransferase [Anaerolineales bacterium]|jgi:aspartate/methionine/tyrosine aminotransferase
MKFSSRIPRDLTPNGITQVIESKLRSGVSLIDLTLSNPTRAGFSYPREEILSALSQPQVLDYDPGPRGLPLARAAIAEYYREQGVTISAESVFPTASTSEAYSLLFKLLADPDDRLLVPRPSYPLIEVLAQVEALRPVPYRLRRKRAAGWELDLEQVARRAEAGCRAIVAVSPNNPTGSYLKPLEKQALSNLARERGSALIVDEVFLDYPAGGQSTSVSLSAAGNEEALTFVLSGLSKVAGLPQIKLSWIVISGPEPDRSEAQERLEFISDSFLSASTPAQIALPTLLRGRNEIQDQIRARLAGNEARLRTEVESTPGVELMPREGGWYAVLKIDRPASDEELARELLLQDDVLVHPGFFYDFPSGEYLVLSLLAREEDFERGAARIRRRLSAS